MGYAALYSRAEKLFLLKLVARKEHVFKATDFFSRSDTSYWNVCI